MLISLLLVLGVSSTFTGQSLLHQHPQSFTRGNPPPDLFLSILHVHLEFSNVSLLDFSATGTRNDQRAR